MCQCQCDLVSNLRKIIKKKPISNSLYNLSRSQVEVFLDDGQQLRLVEVGRSVIEDGDRERLSQADGVADLDQAAAANAGLDQRLGHPAGSVSCRAVDLGEVLAGESAASVRPPTAVRVDDDLATGETGVALRAADDEVAARVNVHDRVLVEILLRNHNFHDLLHDLRAQLFQRDLLRVLHRDDDGVHALRDASAFFEFVFGGDLVKGDKTASASSSRREISSEKLVESSEFQ